MFVLMLVVRHEAPEVAQYFKTARLLKKTKEKTHVHFELQILFAIKMHFRNLVLVRSDSLFVCDKNMTSMQIITQYSYINPVLFESLT